MARRCVWKRLHMLSGGKEIRETKDISWSSCPPASSVGRIHVLKDEGHSAWNVHLCQHNHVSALERNTACDVIKSRNTTPVTPAYGYGSLYNSRGSEKTQCDRPNSSRCDETPLKQSPLEGTIRPSKARDPQAPGRKAALQVALLVHPGE